MISIHISTSDLAAPALRRLQQGLQPARLAHAVGETGRNAVREHLFARDATPNRLGSTHRTHYYGRAGRSTAFTVEGGTVTISVTQIGIRQRFYGGTIKPKTAKYLTIPVNPAAHGKTAREFGDLELVFGAGGRPIALARKARGKRRFGEIMYLLLKSVTQQPDPSTLPTMEALAAAIRPKLDQHIATLTARAHGASS